MWILFADFTVVEPKHTMYLNEEKKQEIATQLNVEPKHTMYLNPLCSISVTIVRPVEPKQIIVKKVKGGYLLLIETKDNRSY